MSNLNLSPEAQSDLADIKAYITKELENPQAALATVTRITKTIRILREHPLIGKLLSATADVEVDYRFLVSGNYRIFYRAVGEDVYVDRILYGRREYLRVLFGDKYE